GVDRGAAIILLRRQHGQLVQVCGYAGDFDIPYLSGADLRAAVDEVDTALRELAAYRAKLIGRGS
ncbi:MAG TPA: hypothetical protein PL183_13495, partial [Aquamicrobium sp.]|nr:hypothetical protein [Aquamicrobium sp.]